MARKYDSESSEEERDRYRTRRDSRYETRRNRGSDRSESSDSDRSGRWGRRERRGEDNGRYGDDKEIRVREERKESMESSDEEGQLAERDTEKRDREENDEREDGYAQRAIENGDKVKESGSRGYEDGDNDRRDKREERGKGDDRDRRERPERDNGRSRRQREIGGSSDEDEDRDRREKRDRERARERKETEDRNRRGNWQSRRVAREDGDSREYRRSEQEKDRDCESRRRDRYRDDDGDRRDRRDRERDRNRDDGRDVRYGRDKEKDERREGGRSLKETESTDAKSKDDSKMPKQTALQGDPNTDGSNLGRSGGVYIPPFKLARMMKEVQDKSSVEYQRLTWDALRKSINGLVNKVNATNIKNIIPELFAENLIRGRGLFCRSCMKSQMASPGFTDVFAALVAVVNTKFPEVGDLLLRRIVLQLKRAYKRNDKPQLLAAVKFIAHLVNQQVAHEIIALELLAVLLENPTDDSVEVAVGFVTEVGSLLQDVSPKGLDGAFERFRGILHEGEIDKRVQYLIEGLFAIRKAKFQGYPAVRPELDLVEQEDQLTHEISLQDDVEAEISLQDDVEAEISLDIFRPDPNFLENERKYEELKKSILGEESDDEEGSDAASDDDEDEEDNESEEEDEHQMQIKDETETNLVNLRRTIYLTIMSSVDFEEAGHKLLKIKLEPGQEMELCVMLLECCSQERTYLRYYGLLGQRFCMINKVYQENFEKCFVQQYSMIHRLETNKLRNVAKFFAHLLGTDALPWHVLAYIRLTEEDTTSSSRIFIKILFQELSEHLGIRLLNERLTDPAMQDSFESIFPRDNPKNTRFSINFFTSIGLGGITENLREYLKNMPRLIMQQQKAVSDSESESGSDSESESSDDSESSESSSESELGSSSSDGDRRRKRGRERDARHSKRSRESDRDQKSRKRSRRD